MNELRRDPLTGRTVLFASGRAGRPNDFDQRRAAPPEQSSNGCPFCAGHESQTPPALAERLGPDGNWTQRVVPNKYPICGRRDSDVCAGAHEVLIESPRHIQTTSELGQEGLTGVLGVYGERLSFWRADGRFPCRMAFKNFGASAGASLAHLHSQLVALPLLSNQQAIEAALIAQHTAPAEAWRQWQEEELSDARRIVAEGPGLVAFCPTASRAAGELWLMPTEPTPFIEGTLADNADELAALLYPLLARLEEQILPAGYNLIVSTAPTEGVLQDAFCWRIEVVPRVAALAGFELSSGMYINTLPPEEAAARYRG
ncbi:galactose-1-phosphate uridylyltransferase [Posidoniimonas polymericola]|uniref:Galactose-1-phosphate uridylyltransferase n=1 Tax=Posidoniimonas polymericola TaxID=2528002 RepID=A0A5C5ZEB0_9BACT|nr:DUF4921 family protein [Posidoniimonas polymericola]TWT85652.1 galactose-1-phosphate uridylyltransferase [Posidoniimonas polymericola]